MPKYLKPEIIQFINSRLGQDRCLWGSNGLPWKESLQQLESRGIREEAATLNGKKLYDNDQVHFMVTRDRNPRGALKRHCF